MLTLALALAAPAFALDCDFSDRVLPSSGEVDVATSAAPVLISPYPNDGRDIWLEDAEGAPVTTTPELLQQEGNRFLRLVPAAPLSPGATYVVRAALPDETPAEATRFTVGEGPDTTPPTGGGLGEVSAAYDPDGEWGEERLISLSLQPATDEDPVYYEVQLAASADFSDAITVRSNYTSAFFGVGLCQTTWEALPLDTAFHLRARAVDLSGNATDWWTREATVMVEAEPVDTGDTDDTGDTGEVEGTSRRCSAAPGVAGWLWAVALAPLARRRRPR